MNSIRWNIELTFDLLTLKKVFFPKSVRHYAIVFIFKLIGWKLTIFQIKINDFRSLTLSCPFDFKNSWFLNSVTPFANPVFFGNQSGTGYMFITTIVCFCWASCHCNVRSFDIFMSTDYWWGLVDLSTVLFSSNWLCNLKFVFRTMPTLP